LREYLRQHDITHELVAKHKENTQHAEVYLTFVDSDIVSFRGFGSYPGVFSTCQSLYFEGQIEFEASPAVLTTGYRFFSQNPMIEFGTILDQAVRAATAAVIPNGVYYPEPFMPVLIPPGENTIPETFLTEKRNYETPMESPILMKRIMERESLSLSRFGPVNPVIVRTPERAFRNKRGSPLKFLATRNEAGKLIHWTEKDFINITTNMTQTHACPRNWATNLLNAFDLRKKLSIRTKSGVIKIENGTIIRNIVISLLSRLFKSYDSISIARD
ncbi:unnamed protein product, partial [marine sediment metagenome]